MTFVGTLIRGTRPCRRRRYRRRRRWCLMGRTRLLSNRTSCRRLIGSKSRQEVAALLLLPMSRQQDVRSLRNQPLPVSERTGTLVIATSFTEKSQTRPSATVSQHQCAARLRVTPMLQRRSLDLRTDLMCTPQAIQVQQYKQSKCCSGMLAITQSC